MSVFVFDKSMLFDLDLYRVCTYPKHQRGAERKCIQKWQKVFALNSRIDPIGDQNDVQYLPVVVSVLNIYIVYLILCP